MDFAEIEENEEYPLNPYKFDVYSLGMSLSLCFITKEQKDHMEKLYLQGRREKDRARIIEANEYIHRVLDERIGLLEN